MQNKKYTLYPLRYYDYLLCTILFFVAFWLQTHRFIDWDVSWHIEGAKRMLHGDTYTKNIFDDNPPMVFWFYMPTVLLHHYTGISLITLNILSVEFSVLISFMLCNACLKLIYLRSTLAEILISRYALLFAVLFIPISIFGSREMLLVVFILPYVMLMSAAIQNAASYHSTSNYFRAFIGLWMGIGIALNPFYGLIPMIIELQYWLHAKKVAFLRVEFITFTLFFLCYLASIKLFYPDYFTVIIPSFLSFTAGFNQPFHNIFFAFPTEIAVLCMILYAFLYFTRSTTPWIKFLFLCSLVSYGIYLLYEKIWFFHYIPELIFSSLLFSVTLGHVLFSSHRDKKIKTAVAFFTALALSTFIFLFANIFTDGYAKYSDSKDLRWQLITYFNHQPQNATIYSLSYSMHPLFEIIDYTSLQPLTPWPGCWSLPIIIQTENTVGIPAIKYKKMEKYKKDLLTQVANDIKIKKPNYVIVDISKYKKAMGNMRFNYIDFFSQNKTFLDTWKHYQLQKIIGDFGIYQLKK